MQIRVDLAKIIITETSEQQVIVLKERDGERSFPIVIGIAEAFAIDRRLKGMRTPRPLTHELLASINERMGGHLEKIVINDLQDHTFFAQLQIRQGSRLVEVDSRPSDAIALGISSDVPIYVEEKIFHDAQS
jgi:bifunctional DNase/RNase